MSRGISSVKTRTNNACVSSGTTLSNEDIDYLIEILKTLYNLTVDLPNLTHSYANQEEEEEGHLMRLVSILRELLLCYGPNDEKQMELHKFVFSFRFFVFSIETVF